MRTILVVLAICGLCSPALADSPNLLEVVGDLSPDASGSFIQTEDWGGYPSWIRDDGQWVLRWQEDAQCWVLSQPDLSFPPTGQVLWTGGQDVLGTYEPRPSGPRLECEGAAAVVPEPVTAGILLAGLLPILLRRR